MTSGTYMSHKWYCVQCCIAALHTVSFVHGCFEGKMHSDWFNGIEILQGRWQHGEKVGYCYRSGLEKTLCKWDIHFPLVTKGLIYCLNIMYRLFSKYFEVINFKPYFFCKSNSRKTQSYCLPVDNLKPTSVNTVSTVAYLTECCNIYRVTLLFAWILKLPQSAVLWNMIFCSTRQRILSFQ